MKTIWCFQFFILLAMAIPKTASGANVVILSEYFRPDPFGGVVSADHGKGQLRQPASPLPYKFQAPRNAYASFQLRIDLPQAGEYSLRLRFREGPSSLAIDLFKSWFHLNSADHKYYPDALIPVQNPYRSTIPDPQNRIEKQISQAFWVDIWIPKTAKPGFYRCLVTADANGKRATTQVEIRVLQAIVPNEDALTIDHNAYGIAWLSDLYPRLRQGVGTDALRNDQLFQLIHAYHRIFYEHRGTFHQLGYGHAGKVSPECAPALAGTGKGKHIASWDLYDRHYGPLLDGSAFADSRRGPRPIPSVYLPVNPEWPASFLWWGEPGYEVEFSNILCEMERHFCEKGWTRTKFEIFFNHKKRYKGFPWDGDETRFRKDDGFFFEMIKLVKKAFPNSTPVQFVFRSDVSWRMEEQFKILGGMINFWVCAKDILSWMPDSLEQVKQRHDIVWIYSGLPGIAERSSSVLENPLSAWVWQIDGYVHWLAVSPSQDPWFHSGGEQTCLVYPGVSLGVSDPLPSIRLKIQRNLAQDLGLMKGLEEQYSKAWLRQQVTHRINGTEPKDWLRSRPALADQPPEEWSNTAIDEVPNPTLQLFDNTAPDFWNSIRKFIYELSMEGDAHP